MDDFSPLATASTILVEKISSSPSELEGLKLLLGRMRRRQEGSVSLMPSRKALGADSYARLDVRTPRDME